ncbi:precorrin-6y C5,15-methyltransferase (decarboxylating) subunit CbiE [Propionimicrobium sp. PCR01-08-3]|nr:precorrin-6y C5,15-methyltransferase (decarboxylating) subunit CbiE [Propionimicrobium sp. PCR01-08-3]WIY82195.1 precorrin-6y C5,15-methyltransferase (decarboxylating) subunit CbiE [Propionimicrobium sp. PCR01-08-3]
MITVFGYIGSPSAELRDAAADAALVVGGRRHLDALNIPEERRVVLGAIAPAIEAIQALPDAAKVVVIASGDPLFYGVVRRMRVAGLKVRVIPVVTSLQLAFAAVALPWDDALLVSLHGNDPAPAIEVLRSHPKVGLLTDGKHGLPQIVDATAGLGRTYVLAERLGESDEQVRVLTEDQARKITEPAQPNVVLVLAHHPDDPAALGEQTAIVGGFLAGGAQA